jgi:uncharacterized membrane protein HdeD (DUF308 family)
MTMQSVSPQVKSTLNRGVPWRSDAAWWLVVAEGILAAGFGLYAFLQPEQSRLLLGQILAVVLIVIGGIEAYASLKQRTQGALSAVTLLRSGIAINTGLTILALSFAQIGTVETGRIVLAVGLALVGLVGFAGAYLARRATGATPWAIIINSGVALLLAILFLYAQFSNTAQNQWITVLITLVGLVLIGYGIHLRGSGKGQGTESTTAAPAANPPESAAAQPADQGAPDSSPPPV